MNFFPPQTCYYLFGLKLPLFLNYFLPVLVFYRLLEKLFEKWYFRAFLICLPAVFILIKLLRNDFFFQSDDFAHLKIAAEYSFGEVFHRGMGRQAIWGFHHIFLGFWLFKFVFIFFKTNLEAYLFTNFLLHILNIGVFYQILRKIEKGQMFSVLITFLFATFYLSWISNIHELLASLFFLLTILFWILWITKTKRNFYFAALFSYLLAISSKEITFILPIILVLFSVFWQNYILKVNFRKKWRGFLPFFALMIIHFLVYGKVYLNFFSSKGDGYSTSFDFSVFLKNFLVYLSQVMPIIDESLLRLSVFLLILVVFDFLKKKLIVLPLFFCYLFLLSPPSFFERKIASYYAYIPSIFLYFLFFVLSREIFLFFKRRKLSGKLFNIYLVLIILLGVFKIDKFLMDNCFLTLMPWENPHKNALFKITAKIEEKFKEGGVKEGDEIFLSQEEATHEMKYLFTTNGLYLFLVPEEAIDYQFVYNEKMNSLVIKEESSYHQMSF